MNNSQITSNPFAQAEKALLEANIGFVVVAETSSELALAA